MESRVYFTQLNFNDGTVINLEKNDIVIFVGPNNVGKSVALKNIWNSATPVNRFSGDFSVIVNSILETDGDFETLKIQLNEKYRGSDSKQINFKGQRINIANLEKAWDSKTLYYLEDVLLQYLSTETRISLSDAVENLDFQIDSPRHPFHHLYLDDAVEQKISAFFRQAFNSDLILNRFGGSKLHLHVGEKPVLGPTEDRSATTYTSRIRQLPLISTQGDGMRSFASILLEIYTNNKSALFIDEPEAFLHPPQAKLIGKLIGDLDTERQIFISTHSSDFIKGILEGKKKNIKIVRITRKDAFNTPNVLDKEGIKNFWKEPMLRYSPIIDGLFHSNVIVCESEGDCRFYFALLNSIFPDDNRYYKIIDTLFIAAHGKSKIHHIVSSLKALKVPTYVIVDFDVFNNVSPLKELVLSQNGDWEKIASDWNIFKSAIESQKHQLNRKESSDRLQSVINSSSNENLSSVEIEKLKDILKSSSNWSFAKKNGLNFVPKGDAYNACQRVLTFMNSIGVFPLPIGELESFDKTLTGSKSEWLEKILLKDLPHDSNLKEARSFINNLVDQIIPAP